MMSSVNFLADRTSSVVASLSVRHQILQRRALRVFAFAILTALTMSLASTASAQDLGGPLGDPNPSGEPVIENFGVDWVEVDPTLGTYRFTLSGTARNMELLVNPAVEIEGYPFENVVAVGIDGSFSVETTELGEDGFGRTIVAVITDNGEEVSLPAYAST
jgi:hypothetical protein